MRAPINQLKHSSSFILEFPFPTTICLGCGRSDLCTEWPEATWLFCSLPMPDLQESLQFAGSVRESSGLDTIFESGLWINDSPQEVSKQGKEQKRGEREAGVILKPQGRKKEAVSNWRVQEERKQISESLLLHSMSPQHSNLRVNSALYSEYLFHLIPLWYIIFFIWNSYLWSYYLVSKLFRLKWLPSLRVFHL